MQRASVSVGLLLCGELEFMSSRFTILSSVMYLDDS
jgi:hypothetical protein